MRNLFTIMLVIFTSFGLFAQTGADCTTPHVITALPFTATGLTTAGSNNDYDATACNTSTYMSGEDYVFTFTPASNIFVDITLTNTGSGVGLFVMDNCPDASPNCVDYAEGLAGNPSLTQLSLTAGITYYIIVSTYDLMGFNPNTPFDIEIVEIAQNDAGVTAISGVESGCGLTANEQITVDIHNYGLVNMSNFNVSYQINGGTPVTELVSATILPDTFMTYTFATPADLSTGNTVYEIKAYTSLTGDGNNLNDTAIVYVANQPTYNTYPYVEDFEMGDGWWMAGGVNSSWDLGTPAATIINTAASGSNAWVTNLTGNHNTDEVSELKSPCFDLTSISNPKIEFNIWYETTMFLGTVTMLYTTDNGQSWDTLVPGTSSINWFNNGSTWTGSSAGWLNALNSVPYIGNNSSVQFKFAFDGGFIASEGVAIDSFSISDCTTPAPVAGFNYSVNGSDVSFTNTSTGATSYYWDFGEVLATSTDENPTHTYLMPGTYTVMLVAMNDCGSDTIYQTIDILTNIKHYVNNNIHIYPNPAKDYISIETGNNNAMFEITNLNGRKLLTGKVEKGIIDVSTLKSGVYFINIITETDSNIFRLFIN